MKFVLCILAALPILLFARTAESTDSDLQQWSTVNFIHPITSEVDALFGLRVRFDDDISNAKDLTLRPGIIVKGMGGISLGLGFDHVQGLSKGDSNENRAWQSIGYDHGILDIHAAHRIRLEERFLEGISGTIVRARYRLGFRNELPDSPWYLTGSNEVLVNLNSQGEGPVRGFEQNRIFLGMARELTAGVRFEFGYQLTYEEKRRENEIVHSLILKFTALAGALKAVQ